MPGVDSWTGVRFSRLAAHSGLAAFGQERLSKRNRAEDRSWREADLKLPSGVVYEELQAGLRESWPSEV